MAAGDTIQGQRISDGERPRYTWPNGAYGRVECDGEWLWYCVTPNGHHGSLAAHAVTEHEDGTITVSPSILVRGGLHLEVEHWHGYLERGVWRDV